MLVKNSFIRSWEAIFDGWSFHALSRIKEQLDSCKIIYCTRHKACYLIPEELSGLPCKAVFKVYREKRFFRYFLRPSLAYREFIGFRRTADAGIPVAEVLALGEKRRGFRLQEAFFVTRYLENFRDGNELIPSGADETLRDEFIRQNLALLAKLHNAGLVHGCFHPRNELFRLDENGRMEVVWLDLASVIPAGKSRKFTVSDDLDRFLREFMLSPEKTAEYTGFYSSLRSK